MSMVFDTPDGIAFFRAVARQGAAKMGKPGIVRILKDVYGYTGSPAAVKAMHADYVEGTLAIREWPEARADRAIATAKEAIRRAEEEYGDTYTKDTVDGNVQAFFEAGSITEEEGNDACLLIFVEVVRQHAGNR